MVNLQRSLEDDGYGRFSPESVEGWISRAESDIEQWVSRLRTPHVGGARAYIGELFTSLHSTGRYSFSQTKEIIGSLAGSAARYRARSLNALEIACRVVQEIHNHF